MFIAIITGLSGSGKTTASHVLEDMGFFCVANLPATMTPDLLRVITKHGGQNGEGIDRVALIIDARGEKFLSGFTDFIKSVRKKNKLQMFYLQAREDIIIKRYKNSRRRHPLNEESVAKGLAREKKILEPLRKMADKIIDTSAFNIHDLKRLFLSQLQPQIPSQ